MELPLPLKDDIARHISNLQGWCTFEKAWRLAELVLEHRLQWMIEIGIFGGRSIIPIALACRHQQFGRVYGLDPWDPQHAIEGNNGEEHDKWWTEQVNLKAIQEHFESHVVQHNLLEWLHWFRLGSVEGTKWFQDGWANMIHLDADHSEETSCRDVGLWLPKLAPGGFFVMDDTDWPSQAKAVKMIEDSGFQRIEDYKTWAIFHKPAPVLAPGVVITHADAVYDEETVLAPT